jgi:two-component system, NarL family, sensor histidine kinase UhpB
VSVAVPPTTHGSAAPLEGAGSRQYIGLFWRLFIPNAIVLGTACVVLMVQPPNGRVPVLVAGLLVMLGVNLLIIRRATAPLGRLTQLMRHVDPLQPGQRIQPAGPTSEVTVLAETFNDMLDRLEEERSSSGRRALTELEAERRRIAAELHDQIGQSLTAVALHLDRSAASADDGQRKELLDVRDEVLGAVEEVRNLARQLRPEALDTLGLVPALTNLIQRFAHHTGLRIQRDLARNLPPLSQEAELVVYRVTQESLTNAARHAAAEHVLVRLAVEDRRVELLVRDDGTGIARDAERGAGITSMQERALAVGAALAIEPRGDGTGTDVRLTLNA